jgi:hypothetical protein
MKASDFARKRLNLVLVLDVSGSMGEAFNAYYYDSAAGAVPADASSEGEGLPAPAKHSTQHRFTPSPWWRQDVGAV